MVGEKRPVVMAADKGVPGGVAGIDETGAVIGALAKDGYGVLANGSDLAQQAGKNGWYMLADGSTYINAPEGYSGWGALWVLDKVAFIYQLNTGVIFYISNLTVTPVPWGRVYTSADIVALRDALKAIW